MMKRSLSVILPAYNEGLNITTAIEAVFRSTMDLFEDVEVIVVDDGSSDNTSELVQQMQEKEQRLRLVKHDHNLGYGAALRSGFSKAENKYLFFTDADNQFDLNEIALLAKHLSEYNMVLGYREKRQDPMHRIINSNIGNFLARTLLGIKVKDINCAFKFFERKLIQDLPLTSNGALINTEVLAYAKKQSWSFIQCPVTHLPRESGTQTGAKLSVIFKTFMEYFVLHRKMNVK